MAVRQMMRTLYTLNYFIANQFLVITFLLSARRRVMFIHIYFDRVDRSPCNLLFYTSLSSTHLCLGVTIGFSSYMGWSPRKFKVQNKP